MTYNFDPERWYDNEHAFLREKYAAGEISEREYAKRLEILMEKLEAMWTRVDGSYQMSASDRSRL